MGITVFTRFVVADCLQRHSQRVEAARNRVAVLANELDSARTQLERAVDDERAFKNFCIENQP